MAQKIWYTYDDIHRTVKHIAQKINEAGVKYDAMIAIGAVTTAYYLNETDSQTTDAVQKIQWLDPIPTELQGKNVLVVDEVDDSRTTMRFVLDELERDGFKKIGVAVIHNKLKPKVAELPADVAYFSGVEIEDWWINYPWDATDIEAHNCRAAAGVHSDEE